MKETRLLIVDTDTASAHALCSYLSRRPEFRVIGTASDGIQAQTLLESAKPDIVLMDLLLPRMDGICLLKHIQSMKCPPIAICQSEFYSPTSIEAARRNGASYYIFKPLSIDSLTNILLEYAAMLNEAQKRQEDHKAIARSDERMSRIHHALQSLGFSSRYSGSAYLAESILLSMESPMMLHNLSSGLYRELSTRLSVSPESVERSIRTAIAAANAGGRLTRELGGTPTNKACIQHILHMMNSSE